MAVLDAFRLDGRVAVVTGASRGLGRAASIALAEAGARLALCARSLEGLAETAAQVEERTGVAPLVEAVDVTDVAAVDRFMERVSSELGGASVLLNNAGRAHQAMIRDVTPEDWSSVIATNLDAVFWFARAFVRQFPGGPGSIINIASIGTAVGVVGQSAYCASKGGVASLTKALALELAREGIRVNAIAPGYFATDMPAEVLADDDAHRRLLSMVPLRRIPDPREIGPPVVFLASEASSFMTGEIVYVDGGYTAK